LKLDRRVAEDAKGFCYPADLVAAIATPGT
jgi:hypothetical protein